MKTHDQIKELAKKFKKEASQFGYDIKLNHALEIISRSHYNQNWHVLKSKLEKPKAQNELYLYFKNLKNGTFKDTMVYGVSDQTKDYLLLDPLESSGAFYYGATGTGKSLAMRFSLSTHMATNSHNTIYFLIDTHKNLQDYQFLLKDEYRQNIISVTKGVNQFVDLIELLYKECMERKEKFIKVNTSNISDYDRKIRNQNSKHKDLARIVVGIEEFYLIMNSEIMNFNVNFDTYGTVANKFMKLMRIGRSYGVFFMFTSQRASEQDLPQALKRGISLPMAFFSKEKDSVLDFPHYSDLHVSSQGLCAYADGFLKFPFLDDNSIEKILKEYYKPLEAQALTFTPEDCHKKF